jgi:hypothetical protein
MQFHMTPQQKVNLLAAGGDVNDVKRFYRDHGISPDWRGANLTARSGKMAMLGYLHNYQIRPTNQGVVWAAEKGYMKVVRFLARMGVNLTGVANAALCTGNMGIVVMLRQEFKKTPDRRGVEMAVVNNNPEAVRFASKQFNLHPTFVQKQNNIVFKDYY